MKWCDNAYGMKYVALRYFNVAGAKDASIGEDHTPETYCANYFTSGIGPTSRAKYFWG